MEIKIMASMIAVFGVFMMVTSRISAQRPESFLFGTTRGRGRTSPTTTVTRRRTATTITSTPSATDAPGTVDPALTVETINSIKSIFKAEILQNVELIPAWVQLGFHSCVGGCDGCLDNNNRNNIGLVGVYADLKLIHNAFNNTISLADFLALAAAVAAETGMGTGDSVPMRFGRADCSNLDGTDKGLGLFPAGTNPHAFRDLETLFDLTTQEAVALIGAHSLGRCDPNHLGFAGPWDFSEDKLDNGFWLSMTNINWQRTRTPNGGDFQWNSTDNALMMLTADLGLLRDLTPRRRTGRPRCSQSNNCNFASTSSMVNDYSESNTKFLSDFIIAFVKMLETTESILFEVKP